MPGVLLRGCFGNNSDGVVFHAVQCPFVWSGERSPRPEMQSAADDAKDGVMGLVMQKAHPCSPKFDMRTWGVEVVSAPPGVRVACIPCDGDQCSRSWELWVLSPSRH